MCMDSDETLDLDAGDFLYQSDQELFLVVMEERDDSYKLAVHGWREIGKNRLQEYTDGENGKLHRQADVDDVIEQDADDDTAESYEQLYSLFDLYTDGISDDGPSEEFALEDT